MNKITDTVEVTIEGVGSFIVKVEMYEGQGITLKEIYLGDSKVDISPIISKSNYNKLIDRVNEKLKVKLEVGKWYKVPYRYGGEDRYNLFKFNGKDSYQTGFLITPSGSIGFYKDGFFYGNSYNLRYELASRREVIDAFYSEAVRRGFVEGSVVSMLGSETRLTDGELYLSVLDHLFFIKNINGVNHYIPLFRDGDWVVELSSTPEEEFKPIKVSVGDWVYIKTNSSKGEKITFRRVDLNNKIYLKGVLENSSYKKITDAELLKYLNSLM